jgi:cytochrome c biogenesis protein CcmG, thiol:disulfide interchange protein DsbE
MRRALSPISLAVVLVLGALIALLAYGLSSNEPDRSVEESLSRGEAEPAPHLELPRLSGTGTGSLADYRGKVVVLNVWASWCKPCRDESPLLQRWHTRMAAKGGMVLGVDVLDVDSDARDFVREFRLTYPQLRDGDGDVLEDYGVIQYPETFVIDRQGRIVAVQRGPVDDGFMRKRVAPLLREGA